MRKTIVAMTVAGLVAGLVAMPAHARGKAKKVHDSFGASLLPFPKNTTWGDPVGLTRPGCSAGEEGVNWVAQPFTSPGKGNLRLYMEGFQGDHDIYIFNEDQSFVLARSDHEQVGAEMYPPEEEIIFPLTKGQKIVLIACNWAGEPDVEAHYEGTFR